MRNAVARIQDGAPVWAAELGLSDREWRFVTEYVVDLHQTNAAVRAGLGKTRKSSTELASRMRKDPRVAKAINRLITESGTTGAAVIGELGTIAFSRITDYLKLEKGRLVLTVSDLNDLPDGAKAAISKLRERVNEDGSISIEVELHDKLSALDKLGKSVGLYKDRVEVSGPNGGAIPVSVEDSRARLIEMLDRKRKRLFDAYGLKDEGQDFDDAIAAKHGIEPIPRHRMEIEPPKRFELAPPDVPKPVIDAE